MSNKPIMKRTKGVISLKNLSPEAKRKWKKVVAIDSERCAREMKNAEKGIHHGIPVY